MSDTIIIIFGAIGLFLCFWAVRVLVDGRRLRRLKAFQAELERIRIEQEKDDEETKFYGEI
jgi:hypothetical protein